MWYKRKDRYFKNRRCKDKNGKYSLHPSYIVGEERNKYYALGITHEDRKDSKHKNHKLSRNPNTLSNSTRASYMKKQIELATKYQFYNRLYGYRMSPEDDDYVDKLVEKKRKYLSENKKK